MTVSSHCKIFLSLSFFPLSLNSVSSLLVKLLKCVPNSCKPSFLKQHMFPHCGSNGHLKGCTLVFFFVFFCFYVFLFAAIVQVLSRFSCNSHEPPLSHLHNISIEACALETRNYVRVLRFLILRLPSPTSEFILQLDSRSDFLSFFFPLALVPRYHTLCVFAHSVGSANPPEMDIVILCCDEACLLAAFSMRALPNKALAAWLPHRAWRWGTCCLERANVE